MIKTLIKSRSKRLLFFILIVILIFIVIDMVFNQLVINTSNSHKGTVFWKTDEKPIIGDFVYFELQHRLLSKQIKSLSKSSKTKVLSKKLVCIEGDTLVVDDNFIVCNNQKYPIKRNIKTSSGQLIEKFYYDGVVPSGQAIVWGSNLESFDSRYFGFVGYGKLRKMVLVF